MSKQHLHSTKEASSIEGMTLLGPEQVDKNTPEVLFQGAAHFKEPVKDTTIGFG